MYLIDTNILIYHINESIPDQSKLKIRDIFLNNFNISVVTKMEFLGFKGHTDKSFEQSKSFMNHASVYPVDNHIVETVIDLKRNYSIKLPDAIIAATAMYYNLILVTRNDSDFKNLNLTLYNPFS